MLVVAVLLLIELVGEDFLLVVVLLVSFPVEIRNFSRLLESSERMRLIAEPVLVLLLMPLMPLGSESFRLEGIMLVTIAISFCILISPGCCCTDGLFTVEALVSLWMRRE
jgi:hypothetical protein